MFTIEDTDHMQQDIGTIISKGFKTWTRNLNISLPFILNFGITVLIALVAFVVFIVVLVVPKLSSMNIDPKNILPEQMLGILSSVVVDHMILIIAGFVIIMVLMMFIQSYFIAGAIGMSKVAMETGDTHLKDMYHYGNKNAVNLFWINVLITLITFAGIIFVVPGVLVMEDLNMFLSNTEETVASSILFIVGFLVWILYIIIVTIILSIVNYALVVENLDPISALETGFRFFMSNKFDILLMWLVLIAISIFIEIIGIGINLVPVLSILWIFIDIIISIAVIPPLTTVWWTRLYLSRTGRKMYDINEFVEYS
ncbi:MAG TPA: hypothetical protein C5S50_03210 [Methanosarcinaceae archaeon]|nr:hypothetical protein [Methanosarcinaceae archaeon]